MSYVRTSTSNPLGRRTFSGYVAASTANPLGRRPLSWYEHAKFPLPTTSMSRPINAPRLGWDNGPYPIYRQPEASRTALSGEWVPPGPPPRAVQSQGMVTYRIDPATGKYQFYSADIVPRGVWQQNVFQHPAPPAITALGEMTEANGRQLVQLPNGMQVLSASSPHVCKCKRRGSCKKKSCGACSCARSHKRLGADDTFIDSNGCTVDSDGNLLSCPNGDPNFNIGTAVANATGAPPLPAGVGVPQPTAGSTANSIVQSILAAFTQPPVVSTPGAVQQQPSWFNGSTNIGGTIVKNSTLAAGGAAAMMAIVLLNNKGGRRR